MGDQFLFCAALAMSRLATMQVEKSVPTNKVLVAGIVEHIAGAGGLGSTQTCRPHIFFFFGGRGGT